MKLSWFSLVLVWLISEVATPVTARGVNGQIKDNGLEVIPTCRNGYEKVINSTMCVRDSANYVTGSAGVSRSEIRNIIDRHNYYRARVFPTATNMMKMYWDDELARVAEKWAKQCIVGHDSYLNLSRYIPEYGMFPGQNGAFGFTSWEGAIDGWYNEVNFYRYGVNTVDYLGDDGWRIIGHYTQVMTYSSVLVGCAFTRCKSIYKNFYFCNYLTGQKSFSRPYKKGTPCADCPNSCIEGKLCDCGDTFCFNGGTLDIDTCQCRCKTPWFGPRCLKNPCPGVVCKNGGTLKTDICTCSCAHPYTGQTCEINPCPGLVCKNGGKVLTESCTCSCQYPYSGPSCETLSCRSRLDPSHCGKAWPPSFCTKFSNVKRDCAVMCGLCSAPCDGKICLNSGTLNPDTCKCSCKKPFKGSYCEIKSCPKSDPFQCGAQWPKSFCQKYTNVPEDCPILCGICEESCNGKSCQNNGQLDPDTCRCSCKKPFTGTFCENKNCPKSEPVHCGTQWPTSYCKKFGNVPGDCPIMCGICEPPCNGKTCQNQGKLDVDSCRCNCEPGHIGPTCEMKGNCPNKDLWYCGSQWTPDMCTKFSNAPQGCPIMCGLCPAPCNGKVCQNKGTLNTDTCTCKCTKGYTGDRCQTERCSGRICQNGGKMDFNSCKCSCSKLYSGDLCQIKNCPKSEPFHCGREWPVEYCQKFSNVPNDCPFLCGVCQAPCNGKTCQNSGKLDVDSCNCKCEDKYTGDTCQREKCGVRCENSGKLDLQTCECSCSKLYHGRFCEKNCICGGKRSVRGKPPTFGVSLGNAPTCDIPLPDKNVCHNAGGLKLFSGHPSCTSNCPKSEPSYCGKQWPVAFCNKFSNVPETCPIMCGLCAAPCNGKRCLNGGKLDVDSCECDCQAGFSGTTCQSALCPGRKCQNGGEMDFKTCLCSCTKLYSGSLCTKKNCPKSDPFYCGKQWPKSYCTKFSNVPEGCPHMCGLCTN